ncbi:hypothetical protein ACFLY6_00910, partial [Candidatus Dependentiae bacterium]
MEKITNFLLLIVISCALGFNALKSHDQPGERPKASVAAAIYDAWGNAPVEICGMVQEFVGQPPPRFLETFELKPIMDHDDIIVTEFAVIGSDSIYSTWEDFLGFLSKTTPGDYVSIKFKDDVRCEDLNFKMICDEIFGDLNCYSNNGIITLVRHYDKNNEARFGIVGSSGAVEFFAKVILANGPIFLNEQLFIVQKKILTIREAKIDQG